MVLLFLHINMDVLIKKAKKMNADRMNILGVLLCFTGTVAG